MKEKLPKERRKGKTHNTGPTGPYHTQGPCQVGVSSPGAPTTPQAWARCPPTPEGIDPEPETTSLVIAGPEVLGGKETCPRHRGGRAGTPSPAAWPTA